MSKRQLLMVLGVWVMALLFLGFPSYLDKIFALITGLLIIAIAFKFSAPSNPISTKQVPYVEHKSVVRPRVESPASPAPSTPSSAPVAPITITKDDLPITS